MKNESNQIQELIEKGDFYAKMSKTSYQNGSIYQGELKRGTKEGVGFLKTLKSEYRGQFIEDKKHGYGIELFNIPGLMQADWTEETIDRQPKYKGFYFEDKFDGIGEIVYLHKGTYKGQFKQGNKHGQGFESYPNGDSYRGQFQNDYPNGKGVFKGLGKFKYDGVFHQGFRHGKGKVQYADQSTYVGNFRYNMKHGFGEYHNKQLNIHYSGYWKLGTMWGYGIKEFQEEEMITDLTVYEGWFVNGHFHGVGSLNYPEGSYLYANFRNGEPDSSQKVLNYNCDNDCWYTIDTFNRDSSQNPKEGKGFPPQELDCSKTETENCYIYKKKFEDTYFRENQKLQLLNYDPKDIAFYRLSFIFDSRKIFSKEIGYDMFQPGPFTNIEFATCFEALCKHPNLVQNLFSEKYSHEYGFYVTNFFNKGYFKEQIVDNNVPCDSLKRTPLFMNTINNNYGPLIIEKAYAKFTRSFYNFHKLPKNICDSILYHLTGFANKIIPINDLTDQKHYKKFKQKMLKYKDFKIRIAYLNQETAKRYGFKKNHPYVLVDIYKSDNQPVFVFKSIKGVSNMIKTQWVKDPSMQSHQFRQEYGERVKKFTDGMFLCGYDELHQYFQEIVISLARPYQIIQTVTDRIQLSGGSGNTNLFYEMKVPFQTSIVIQVEQYFNNAQTSSFPIRMIIAKNIKDKIIYVCGIGQKNQRQIAKLIELDHGQYFIFIQIQVQSIKDIDLVLSTWASNHVTIEKYKKQPPPNFLQRVYIDCANKYGERQNFYFCFLFVKRIDLSEVQNGSKDMKLIQLFRQSDGVYLQFFQNNSKTVIWKHKVVFTYSNMKLFRTRKKNVKHTIAHDSTQIELSLKPQQEHLILFCQQNADAGGTFKIQGGVGTCDFFKIEDLS